MARTSAAVTSQMTAFSHSDNKTRLFSLCVTWLSLILLDTNSTENACVFSINSRDKLTRYQNRKLMKRCWKSLEDKQKNVDSMKEDFLQSIPFTSERNMWWRITYHFTCRDNLSREKSFSNEESNDACYIQNITFSLKMKNIIVLRIVTLFFVVITIYCPAEAASPKSQSFRQCRKSNNGQRECFCGENQARFDRSKGERCIRGQVVR